MLRHSMVWRTFSEEAIDFIEVIPKEHWDVPSWIHPDMMQASFDKLDSEKVQYAKMLSYHKMCRWNSGLFYKHPALANYTWYWRVEPNVQYSLPVPKVADIVSSVKSTTMSSVSWNSITKPMAS